MRRRYIPNEMIGRTPAHLCTFDYAQHLYAIDGLPVPSVTQVLSEERFIDFSSVPDRTLREAQARGTYVHQVLHLYLEDDFDLDDCDPRFRGYVDSAIAYLAEIKKKPLRDRDGKPIAVEWRFWDPERRFAGTLDYLGWDGDDVLSIDDFKTGTPSDVAAPVQLAAYEYGVRKFLVPGIQPKYTGTIRRRAVKLFANGAPARAEVYTDPRDLQMFFAALTCVHFRRNNLSHVGYGVA